MQWYEYSKLYFKNIKDKIIVINIHGEAFVGLCTFVLQNICLCVCYVVFCTKKYSKIILLLQLLINL